MKDSKPECSKPGCHEPAVFYGYETDPRQRVYLCAEHYEQARANAEVAKLREAGTQFLQEVRDNE